MSRSGSRDTDPGRVSIRPGVSVLSVLKHLNYQYWFAIAEFVDNAVQSFAANRARLQAIHGPDFRLEVSIELSGEDGGRLVIRDNAAGIPRSDFPRAFRPAVPPSDRSGLSEFGMGMKSAACWCAREWSVETSALGEPTRHLVAFDVDRIVENNIEELVVQEEAADRNLHFTEVRLIGLHKIPTGNTLKKIKTHLADIYREFTRSGQMRLTFDRQPLIYEAPAILTAPLYRDYSGPAVRWEKEIKFDLGGGMTVKGFAALRDKLSTTRSGFSLFRRGRVIQGSGETGYRPEFIFGRSSGFTYQRLFGELHLEGFEVSHTKDGFRWDENEEPFLELLKEHLSSDDVPLLLQARNYRVGDDKPEELASSARAATDHTAEALQQGGSDVIDDLRQEPEAPAVPAQLASLPLITRREITIPVNGWTWVVSVEMSADEQMSEWLAISEQASRPDADNVRRLGLRLSLAHPFMRQFAGADVEVIEPLLRVGVALGLAETIAREGRSELSAIRRNLNDLLRRALHRP